MRYAVREPLFDNNAFEAIFKQAVIDELDAAVAASFVAMPSEMSEARRNRMDALFAVNRRRESRVGMVKVVRRAVAVAAIVIIVAFAALMSVPSLRAAVSETIIRWFDTHTKFNGGVASNDMTRWEPTVIPEGFAELTDERVDDDDYTSVVYENKSGLRILFIRVSADDSVSVNNEGVKYGQASYDGVVYHTFDGMSQGRASSVVWDMDGMRMMVDGDASIDELIKMARSIKRR